MPLKKPFKASQLHVISVISNSERFRTRYALYRQFEKMCLDAGVTLWTCEIAFGDRPFEVTSPKNPRHLQLRTFHTLWHKENMANLMVERLPQDWEYVAFIDADIQFMRTDWPIETIHMLQHHYVIQMWHEAYDLGPDFQVIHKHQSLMWRYCNGLPIGPGGNYYGAAFGHPGYAWAWRREALDHVGGLLDTCILGAADHHMALSLIGRGDQSLPLQIHKEYRDSVMRWQDRALKYLLMDVGYLNTAINHYWHGKKKNRKYVERWSILTDNDFTPFLDLKKDWQGLYQLTDRSPQLRDQIRLYFKQRSEDSIDL